MADKKTLELEIKIAAEEALRVTSSMSDYFKTLTAQAKQLTGDSSSLSSQLQTLQTAAARTANSFKLFGANTEEIRGMQQQLKKAALDLTDQGFDPQSEEVQNLVSQYKTLDEQAENVQSSQGGLLGTFEKLKTEAGSLVTVLAAVKVDKAAGAMTSYALDQADAINTVRNNFGIMLKDMQAGAALATEINNFNVKTPFNLDQISQATEKLNTAKISVADMYDWLRRFGDLAKGGAQQFDSFTSAYEKSAAKNKADMEVLNVYADQGIPIFEALGTVLKTDTDKIADMSSKGKISFKDLTDAIKYLTDEGGGYYGTMELASQSWASAQAGLKEATNSLAASIGQVFMPAAQGAAAVLTSIVNAINDSPILKGTLVAAVTALVVIINAKMIVAVVSLITKIWAQYAAQTALNSALAVTNPLMLAGIAAATLAAGAAVAYATSQQRAAEATNAQALAMKSAEQNAQSYYAALKNMSSGDLQQSIAQLNMQLAQQKQSLAYAQSQLKSTPEKILQGDTSVPADLASPIEQLVDNPKWAELQSRINDINKEITVTTQEIAAANGQASQNKTNEDLEFGNQVLKERDKLYKSTSEGQREQLEQQLKFAESLYTLQTLNKDGTYTGFDTAKTGAIIKYLKTQISELDRKSGELFTSKWTDNLLTGAAKVKAQEEKDIKTLQEQALKAYGDTYDTQSAYQDQLHAFKVYYQKQETEAEMQAVIKAHEERLSKLQEEWKYRMYLAEDSGDWGSTAKYAAATSASSSLQSTEAGQVAQGAMQGGLIGAAAAAIQAFISAIINAISELKNGKKALNFITTIVDKIFDVIGNFVDGALEPAVNFFETLGDTIGKIIRPLAAVAEYIADMEPILQIVTQLLSWIGDLFSVIWGITKPFLDWFKKGYNEFIGWINGIFGTSLKKIGEDADDTADALEEAEDKIKALYQEQIDLVNDQLNAQLQSLQTQYELGLMTRDAYNAKAAAYTSSANDKITSLTEEMNEKLAAIKEDTDSIASAISNAISGAVDKVMTGVTDTATSAGVGAGIGLLAGDPITGGIIGGLGHLFGWWDVGATRIPADQFGMVHKDETIIPKTFADGIRSGEMSLVGGNGYSGDGTRISVSLTVQGSVITKNELIDDVYDGLAAGVKSGRYTGVAAA